MQQEKETVSQESHVFTRRQLASMTLPFILDSLSIMLISMLITALISSAGESSVALQGIFFISFFRYRNPAFVLLP